MDQRIVKPVFWPILLLSCAALSVTVFFLIGGMISSRLEDYFIALLAGFLLFLVARTVKKNVSEPPKVAIGLMFFIMLLAATVIFVMHHALVHSSHVNFAAFEGHRLHSAMADLPRGVRYIGQYREWASNLTNAGFTLTGRLYIALHRAVYLTYGIIAAVVFIILQGTTCALLFIGTNPKKKKPNGVK
jgi:energy-coupling factor transporter transmembrane protein EcfT